MLLTSALIAQTGGREFAPKRARTASLFRALIVGPDTITRTLGGCVISASAARVRLWREPGTISHEIPISGGMSTIWDRRFLVTLRPASRRAAVSISALGRGGWRRSLPISVVISDTFPDQSATGCRQSAGEATFCRCGILTTVLPGFLKISWKMPYSSSDRRFRDRRFGLLNRCRALCM